MVTWDRWLGRIRNASTRLIAKVISSTIGTTSRIRPISPDRNIRGVKTQAVVRKDENTPGITSRAPRIDASFSDTRPRHLAMLSAITMESSMISPTAISRPISDTMLMVTPNACSTKIPPRKETGSAIEIQNASRSEKNRLITRKTKTSP